MFEVFPNSIHIFLQSTSIYVGQPNTVPNIDAFPELFPHILLHLDLTRTEQRDHYSRLYHVNSATMCPHLAPQISGSTII